MEETKLVLKNKFKKLGEDIFIACGLCEDSFSPHQKIYDFLGRIAQFGYNMNFAALESGYSASSISRHMNNTKGFSDAVSMARDCATGELERTLYLQAIEGRTVEKFHKGELIHSEHIPLEKTQMFALGAMAPERYRERHSDGGGVNITIQLPDYSNEKQVSKPIVINEKKVING